MTKGELIQLLRVIPDDAVIAVEMKSENTESIGAVRSIEYYPDKQSDSSSVVSLLTELIYCRRNLLQGPERDAPLIDLAKKNLHEYNKPAG